MSCTMYQQGKCLKQPMGGVTVGFFVRRTTTTFRDCQFDGRVWAGGAAFAGRSEDLAKRHEDCSMFEGNLANTGAAAN